jgi:uncharacterized membrane protein
MLKGFLLFNLINSAAHSDSFTSTQKFSVIIIAVIVGAIAIYQIIVDDDESKKP